MKKSILLILICFAFCEMFAQHSSYIIKGRIINGSKNSEIKDGELTIYGTDGLILNIPIDSTNHFSLLTKSLSPNNKYKLSLEIPQKLSQFRNFKIDTIINNTIEINFILKDSYMKVDKFFDFKDVTFDECSFALSETLKSSLNGLERIIGNSFSFKLKISGFQDSEEFCLNNTNIAMKRANEVYTYLLKIGFDEKTLILDSINHKESLIIDSEYDNFIVGDILNIEYINNLKNETDKELAHRLNRRIEFNWTK